MRMFIKISLIFLLIMSTNMFAVDLLPKTGGFGAGILCTPKLEFFETNPSEGSLDKVDLGEFFVKNTTNEITLTATDKIGWELTGPISSSSGAIDYDVYVTNAPNSGLNDDYVVLACKWEVESRDLTWETNGSPEMPGYILKQRAGTTGNCDGYARFKIRAYIITILPLAAPGPREWTMTMSVTTSI
ncbi:MAG: hypothetical protein PF588_09155 [Candidatus Kapabacteria bacterium]|jgi:hypothetical protein|nr:hypothetical protein [Candidatus Kapabacteria bacterium]